MSLREEALREILKREVAKTTERTRYEILDIFGENVFNEKAMSKYLPYSACEKLKRIIKHGGVIDEQLAEEVAHGVKEWAIDKGATHFTHWFQPMTGLTAEKHDSFLSFDSEGQPIQRFSGKNLRQGEPDASSFPSGGIRATFEARGYTAWDPTSPIFIMENANGATLCIPTIFLSYTGEALDKKTPLLRSIEAINKASLRILRIFGNKTATRVYSTVGPEQEYFLIDKAYYYRRPDLILTGRTLFGAPSPKGQQMEDHYFGSIRERILSFMQDAERELFRLGIPAKTRHNEVAPAQFEIAPIFEDSNIATDHNQLVMEVLKKTAAKYDLALLLHEKPFAGINGSGKHNNWSLSDSEGNNLLDPGKTPHENLQFLTFLVATVEAVYKYADLIRASVATAGNDHRLGANEAPPAIISVYLGEQLTAILEAILSNKKVEYSDEQIIKLGISNLPVISKDTTDRNRTSPFAFTGNKFEFRAVGSSMSIATANMAINTAVANILDKFADEIEKRLKKGVQLNKAVMDVITNSIKESKPILFEGNNYSPEWEKEAEKRGLPNYKTTPEALKAWISEKNIEALTKFGILTEREIHSRYHIYLEQYSKIVNIEAETALMIAKTMILPAVLKYQTEIARNLSTLSATAIGNELIKPNRNLLERYSRRVNELHVKIETLEKFLDSTQAIEDIEKQAESYCIVVLPAISELRRVADLLEEETDDSYWPLPKYREMLFIY
ncbi:MAG: glutamine synthetase III [Brevinematia bacterium]